jgi:hypothetical protein
MSLYKNYGLRKECFFFTAFTNWESVDFRHAAFLSCQTLAFIAPDKFIPLFVAKIQVALSPEVYNWISPTDIQIWKGSEGIPVVNGNFESHPL